MYHQKYERYTGTALGLVCYKIKNTPIPPSLRFYDKIDEIAQK
jgi:hypothetical protein